VSTHLEARTLAACAAAAQRKPQAEPNTHYISKKRAAKRAPSEARRLRRAKRDTGDTAGRGLAPGA